MENDNVLTLQHYVNSSVFNADIYDELTEGITGFKSIFEPIDFFNFLYGEYDFFENNKENYLLIKQSYNALVLEREQRYFFLFHLVQLINQSYYDEHYENNYRLSPIAVKSVIYIKKLLENIEKEVCLPEFNYMPQTEFTLDDKQISTPNYRVETTIDENEHVELNGSLKQRILVLKYLEQAAFLNLNKIHQDVTKQATIFSFLLNNSYKTTYDIFRENIESLKTKKNLEGVLALFENDKLKDVFPSIVVQINADIKKLKR